MTYCRMATVTCVICLGQLPAFGSQDIVFPEGAEVVDVVRDFGIDNTGRTDVYPALQELLDRFGGQFRVLYFPKGTYLLGGSLNMRIARERGPRKEGNHGPVMIGESRTETVFRLKDGIWTEPDRRLPPPKGLKGREFTPYRLLDTQVVIHTGDSTNTTFGKVIRNFTVNTGRGNPAAIGVMFCTSNYGHMLDVDIVSEDGNAMCGLALTGAESGPGQVRNVSISGFDIGIYSATAYSFAVSHVAMKGIKRYAIYNYGKMGCEDLTVRMETSEDPAIWNNGLLAVVGLELDGQRPGTAIVNGEEGVLYLRDVTTRGFAGAFERGTMRINELATGAPVRGPFAEAMTALRLPIKRSPEVPFEPDLSKWANPKDYGAVGDGKTDDTEAIKAAFNDPRKTHVIFPRGYWDQGVAVNQFRVTESITIPTHVERVIGVGGSVWAEDKDVLLRVENGTRPLAIEMMRNLPRLHYESNRPLVLLCSRFGVRNAKHADYHNIVLKGTGDVFIHDVPMPILIDGPGQNVWLRHYNNESGPPKKRGYSDLGLWKRHTDQKAYELHVRQGNAWVLGWKSENLRQRAIVEQGGALEVICFDNYSWTAKGQKKDGPWPMFRVLGGRFALCGLAQHGNERNQNIVWETRNGETRRLTIDTNGGPNLSLYSGGR